MSTDHRHRVAAERRQRMRARLLDSALLLAAEHGPIAFTVDDVVNRAEVSRGTFYKYFDAPIDLVAAVGNSIADEVMRTLDPVVTQHDDPAVRIACGTRLVLKLVSSYPVVGSFVVRIGWPNISQSHPFFSFVTRDFRAGVKQGRFERMDPAVALNLIGGCIVGAMHTIVSTRTPTGFAEQVTASMLRGLGVNKVEAEELSKLKLTSLRLADDGILSRLVLVNSARQ